MKKIRIGTRASRLALTQTQMICDSLIKAHPELSPESFEIVKITTTGDKIKDKSLAAIGGKALFTKEIEEALYNKKIDIAMHSMKDVTAHIPKGLVFPCFLQRDDARDALVSLKYKTIDDLPKGAVVGTSSSRRKALLINYRPDLNIVLYRGNIDTRIKRLKEGTVDAAVMAMAGLDRLKVDKEIYSPISEEIMLPAVTQGIIGVQCREDDILLIEMLKSANNIESDIMQQAERGFLETLEGDCSTPLAAHAIIVDNIIKLECLVASRDGKCIYKASREGDFSSAYHLGVDAGREILTLVDIKSL